MIYLDEIQKNALDLLNGGCDTVCPLDKLGNSKHSDVTDEMREKYNILCADLGNLTIKFRPSIGHAFGALL